MRLVLGTHTDFKYEKIALEHFMQERGHRAIFLPKFQELQVKELQECNNCC